MVSLTDVRKHQGHKLETRMSRIFVPILAISSAFVRVDKHIQNLLPLQELQTRGETRK
jgi:hypothetical protein